MSNPTIWFQQAVQHHQAGRLVDAVLVYRHLLAAEPTHPQGHYNLALALHGLQKIDEAIASYQRAITINPNLAEAYNNLANIYMQQDLLEDAQQAYGRALACNPNMPQAQFNLGLVLKRQGRYSQAIEYFRAALALVPDYPEAFDNLYSLLMLTGRTEESLAAFQDYEKIPNKPDWFFVAGLSVCRNLGDFAREKQYLEALYAYPFKDGDIATLENILTKVQYFDVPPAQMLRVYQAYNQAVKSRHVAEFALVSPYRPARARMRIGYLSPDFRTHVMGKLMFDVLSRHDREQFEVYLYSLGRQEDALTAEFRGISHKFVDLHALSERQAALAIAEDDLDILIDLGNHTTDAKPIILAYKPARVQITHLGAHGGVGLDTVDYKLTDRYADLPENAAYMIEKLLPMDGCVFPFRHVEPVVNAALSRAALGIAQDAIVFGAFTSIMKLSPRCLQAWAMILQRVDGAVLAFSPFKESEQPSYLRQVAAAGIDSARIVFIPASMDEQFNRARYALLDISIDTFPYSGGDTTLAALDMGIPVVTVCGQRHSERTSFSILTNLGVAETIANDEAEFIAIAVRLANDPVWRRTVVENIRRGLADSPLVDIDAYTRHLEDAYRTAIAQCPVKQEVADDGSKTLFQEAVRQHQANQVTQAAELYEKVLAHQPEHAAALYLYGKLLEQNGQDRAAINCLRRAVAANPQYLDAHQALGNLLLKLGRLDEAVASFQRALQVKPQHGPALNGLGRALTDAGRLQEAVTVLRQAVNHRPDDTTAYFNLGVVLQKMNLYDVAATAYVRILALEPENLDAQVNLGVLFQEQGLIERAAACYQQALRIAPDCTLAYFNLGELLFGAGKINAWLENFQQFRRLAPPSTMLAIYGLQACQYLGEAVQCKTYLDSLLGGPHAPGNNIDERDRLEELLYLLLFFDIPQSQLFTLYQRYNQLCKQGHAPQLTLPARKAGGKIRLGYLSADFRDHVMGKMMYQAISRHDTEKFEVICYSLDSRQDQWTERFRACSQKFVSLAKLDARTAANRIAEDQLDILVDLSTHTKGSSPGILAFKPARVQITHIASAGAVGLDTIDFKLTDHYADTKENQDYLIERLLPMQGCVFPYRHIAPATQHHYQRDKLGIPENAVVLGAFVALMKLSPRCLALWSQVLTALPQAVLAFSPFNAEARAAYLRWLKAAGIPEKRVVFIPPAADEAQNQARYTVVDMVLDTMPFGGVNGTLEALDMGVPVVTLCGERHGERTGYSILTNLGVPATIAHSEQEFVAIAKRLAEDDAFRTGVVADIRRGLAQSPLADAVAHTRHLEDAYRQALEKKR